MAEPDAVRDRGDDKTRVTSLRLPSPPGSLASAGTWRRWLVLEAPTDCYIPRVLEQKGLAGYEPEALACFLAVATVARPGAVWDVGANIGVYGLLARALTGRTVRAFEPVPALADLAERIAVANGLPYPVERLALGAGTGTATLYLSDVTDSSNSLAAGFRPSSRTLTVSVETVDHVVARTAEEPAVLKVDTETTEPDVLMGAAQHVAAHRPWILCEVLANRSEEALMDVLRSWKYHWFPISDELPYAATDTIHGDPSYRNLMWLLAPERPDQRFWHLVNAWRKSLTSCGPVITGATNLGADLRRARRDAESARLELSQVRSRLSKLEASPTVHAGRIAAGLVRHPLRTARNLPAHVQRLWRKWSLTGAQ